MIQHRFGESGPLSLGVEEELMIVDAASCEQVPRVQSLLDEAAGDVLPGRLKTELFASVVELNTDPCSSASEVGDALRSLRVAAGSYAARHGLRIAAAGSHPLSPPEEQEITDEPRYHSLVEHAGSVARRQGVQGLHVHVGMPDPEGCMRALEGALPWLPTVLALSANSPFLAGAETGLVSTRAEVLGLLPRNGAPPAFDSFGEWSAFVERLVGLGVIPDYTVLWWDIRPHPRFGTLEVRIADQPTRLELSIAFVALLQALLATTLDGPPPTRLPGDRAIYRQNRWAAARFGPRAELIHPHSDRLTAVPELADELLELVAPAASRLGTEMLLAPLQPTRCEGDGQLQVGKAEGLRSVCKEIVEQSLPSP